MSYSGQLVEFEFKTNNTASHSISSTFSIPPNCLLNIHTLHVLTDDQLQLRTHKLNNETLEEERERASNIQCIVSIVLQLLAFLASGPCCLYPNIRSIQLCSLSDTYSHSRDSKHLLVNSLASDGEGKVIINNSLI